MPLETTYPTPTSGPSNIRVAMVDDNAAVYKTLSLSLKLCWPGAWLDPYIGTSSPLPTGVPKSLDHAVQRVKKFKPHVLFVDWNLSLLDAPLETQGVEIDARLDALVKEQNNCEDKEWFQDYPMLIHFTGNRSNVDMWMRQANTRLDAGGTRRLRRAEVLEKFMIGQDDKVPAENLGRVLMDYKDDPRIKRFLQIAAITNGNEVWIQLEDIAHLTSRDGKYVVVTKKNGDQATIRGNLGDFGPNVMFDAERGYFMKAIRSNECLINMQSVKAVELLPDRSGRAHFNDGTFGPGPRALSESDVAAMQAAKTKLENRGITFEWRRAH